MSKRTRRKSRTCRKIIAMLLGVALILPNNITVTSAKEETKKEYVIVTKK